MPEQRKQYRSNKELHIRLFQNGNLQKLAKTQDLTSTGMFIRTDALLFPIGTLIELVFDGLYGTERFSIKAKVIHRSLKGIGVEFQHIIEQQYVTNFNRIVEESQVVA